MAWSSSVECSEEAGTVKENWTLDQFTPSVTLRCAWADRHALVADILYTTRPAWLYGSFVAYPVSAGVVPASGVAFTASGQHINDYGENSALVTFSFSSAAEQTLISESIEPTAESQIQDHRLFMWASDSRPLLEQEAPGRLIRGLNIVRTYYKIASVPEAVFTAVGHCNESAYASTILGFTFAAETLLYTPGGLNRTITTAGAQGWDVTLKFRFQPWGWNKFWRAETQVYDQIKVAMSGTVYKPIPTHAMTGLLA